ncbi:Hsp20/alpha crystallin family protein [Paenibacillus sp. J2TS4]|uniref:Hsp20/alpha crystallin family protein n=1 Tax=Paenibacillus sp. J2TS4 TaxID=2807194 RepID=UPI001B2D62D4|nr:Hsp20/alpha crystallin family protein [Paenibacillus sp. J2TS4]GIP33177.1 hypothetical protein J2TS4_23870 [Paenibacillus sp. J2TS4]
MGTFPDDKLDLQKLFDHLTSGQFPFSSDDRVASLFPDPDWIQNYVQGLIADQIPEVKGTEWSPDPEIFETHRSVFVRFKLPEEIDPYLLKIRVQPASLRLDGWADKELNIKLPALVAASRSKAVMKEGVVEIRMPKSSDKGRGKQLHLGFY